jgi:hypothetical protein
MRVGFQPRPAASMLALLVALTLMASACATTSATAQPTKIAATPGDTGLCAAISAAEFARLTGAATTQVTAGALDDPLTGLREVYCLYLDTADPQATIGRGTINFEVASDPASAARTFETVKRTFSGAEDVGGVGDAAFSGAPGGAGGTGVGLLVRQRSLLLYLSVGGDRQTVERVATRLALVVLGRVAA